MLPLLHVQAIRVHGSEDSVVCSKLIRIFDRKLRLKRGLQRIEVVSIDAMPSRAVLDWWAPVEDTEDGSCAVETTTAEDMSLAEEEEEALAADVGPGAEWTDDAEYFRLLKLKEQCVVLSSARSSSDFIP